MFILDNNGVPLGCIAIVHVDEATAQLRFFFLEPEIRGLGAGRKLIDQAIDFCEEKKYRRVFLWTFSTLMAARHLYVSKGFQITETHENRDWGEPVLEERWDLNL
jgi:GNAT superfamily N-acetyltransferase